MTFQELNLSPEVLKAVEDIGFSIPTEIQQKAIPHLLEGRDVTGRSHTGTGKTATFSIPAIERINEENYRHVSTLILCPTRELAMQAAEEIRKYGAYKKRVKVTCIYGGQSYDRQISALRNGANIVVGTPGRIIDHMNRGTLKLNHLSMIVLDEADEMLNMGFKEDIEKVLVEVPEERQTVLFSATIPPAIMQITKKYQKDPVLVEVENSNRSSTLITQYYCDVPRGQKLEALHLLLQYVNPKLGMIFCNTKRMVDELENQLNKLGYNAAGLHGDMKQSARSAVMERFKGGRVNILIATDVAARGIDVTGVDAVFNFDIPQDCEYYVHRIGRTGRAGKTGVSYTIVSGNIQHRELSKIKQVTKSKMEKINLPDAQEIIQKANQACLEGLKERIQEEKYQHKNVEELLQTLLTEEISLEKIALALLDQALPKETLRLPKVSQVTYNGAGGAGEEQGGRRAQKGGKYDNSNFGQLSINIGRKAGVSANHVVGAIADKAGISGSLIGKINIANDHTLVDIPKEVIREVLEKLEKLKIKNIPVHSKIMEGEKRSGGFKPRGLSTGRKPAPRNKKR